MSLTVVEVLRQLFKKPATNPFPVKHAPKDEGSVTAAVSEGGAVAKLLGGEEIPGVTKGPVPLGGDTGLPQRFRGKIEYDRDACIGCKMCLNVCPAEAIEFIEPEQETGPDGKKMKGKVKFYMTRCTFCGFCTDTCPKNCIRMGKDYLLATTDRFSEALMVYDTPGFDSKEYKEYKDDYY